MPVQEILLLRHGHRLAYTFNPKTATYTSTHPYPTGLPADPPLVSHGVQQSYESAAHLSKLLTRQIKEDKVVIYSSLFYRCLETLRPTVEAFQKLGWKGEVRGETGVGEWFGTAPFEQPCPRDCEFLRDRFFPWLAKRESRLVPNRHGETIDAFHDRIARALEIIVREVDREYEEKGRGGEDVTVLICGHAAGIIASGRALTGRMPEDNEGEEFKCFTCGLSQFRRRHHQKAAHSVGEEILQAAGNWRTHGGVAGGWDCLLNSSCEHLSHGEERGWHFQGDESFDSYGLYQGSATEGQAFQRVEDTNEPKADAPKL